MSWIKKLFQIFKSEDNDVDFIEEPNDIHHRQAKSITQPQPKERGRELDVKVTYQYPKGEFRFPLIPDETINQAERTERTERKDSIERAARAIRDESLGLSSTRGNKAKVAPVKKEVPRPTRPSRPVRTTTFLEREKTEKSAPERPERQEPIKPVERKIVQKTDYSKKPFRPTEIPSPIYGFERPKKKDEPLIEPLIEPIEFELDSFESIGEPDTYTDHSKIEKKQKEDEISTDQMEDVEVEPNKILSEEEDPIEKEEVHFEPQSDNEIPVQVEDPTDHISVAKKAKEETIRDDSSFIIREVIAAEEDQTREFEAKEGNFPKVNEVESPLAHLEEEHSDTSALLEEGRHTSEVTVEDLKEHESKENSLGEVPALEELQEGHTAIHKEASSDDSPILDDKEWISEDAIVDCEAEEVKELKIMVEEPSLNESENHLTQLEEVSSDDSPILDDSELAPEDIPEARVQYEAKEMRTLVERPSSNESENLLANQEEKRSEDLSVLDEKELITEDIMEVREEYEAKDPYKTVEVIPSDELEETLVYLKKESSLKEIAATVEKAAELEDLEHAVEHENDSESGSEETVEEKESNNEIAQPAPKRSHLPFNVIMLKQDKLKFENKFKEKQQQPLLTEEFNKEAEKPKDAPEKREEIEETVLLHEEEKIEPPYYAFPSMNLLNPPVVYNENTEWLSGQEQLLNDTLMNFNVRAKVVNVTQGPSVTRFEVQPEPGVKVNKITNLSDDIKLSLAARDIRIEAPIPGKHTIGIEVPNQNSRPVLISEIIDSPEFREDESPLTVALGLDISGKPVVTDLRKMPHGLIAGATGSGKSVCINTMLVSLLFKAKPEELKLLLIDPKMVELAPYNQIPHLVSPVITDVKAATAALKWAVEEMERRYELFAHTGVRNITGFNELAETHKRYSDKLPYIVIIIDELADLMMMSPADVEEAICRIAQKARACGIHLIIATQRPSVDVITGLIKANVPTRIAFSVSSQIDSRTIIDISGAEKLLGRGDMLFLENGSSKPVRIQGTYVSDQEIDEVVAHVRKEQQPQYLFEQEELLKKAQITEEEDDLFYEACEYVIDQGGASTSSIQRRFKIGYNRAARLIEMMEQQGFISEARGSKPRDVFITVEELESIHDNSSIL